MGFTPHIMYRVAILIAGVAAVPVEVQNNFGPGPSGVPYGPRPGPSYGPLPQGDPQRSYKAKPILVEEEEEFPPQPYKYEYGVQDDYTKAAFAKSESQNEVGAVTGSYKVMIFNITINLLYYCFIFYIFSGARSTCLTVVSRQ